MNFSDEDTSLWLEMMQACLSVSEEDTSLWLETMRAVVRTSLLRATDDWQLWLRSIDDRVGQVNEGGNSCPA
jgi:hypothetical protein